MLRFFSSLLGLNMTSEQIAEAQRLARDWQPTQQPSR